MSQTDSEKLIGDTLRKLQADGRILWGHKLEAQIRGKKFRTPAPLDFVVCTSKAVHWWEVKEVGGTSLGWSHFNDEQWRLLTTLPNAGLVVRFYSDKYNRNNSHYWDEYVFASGIFLREQRPRKKSLTLQLCRDWMGIQDATELIAVVQMGRVVDFAPDAGMTTRGNACRGFTSLPLELED